MKSTLKIMLLLSVPFCIHGCGGDTKAASITEPSDIKYTVIHGNSYLDGGMHLTSKGSRVFSSQDAYQNELLNYSSDQPVQVDFTKSKVLLLDMGQKATGGYGIEIEKIADSNDAAIVSVALVEPGSGCLVTQSLTNPYEFIEISTNKEILIEEKLVLKSC